MSPGSWSSAAAACARWCAQTSRLRELDGVEMVTGDSARPRIAAAGGGGLRARCSTWRRTTGCGRPTRGRCYESNVDGTRNLLAAARDAGVERVVYTSTVGCIGIPQGRGRERANAGGAGRHDGPLQTVEVPGRAGGARVRRGRIAGGDRESHGAGGRPRFQAHADRARSSWIF